MSNSQKKKKRSFKGSPVHYLYLLLIDFLSSTLPLSFIDRLLNSQALTLQQLSYLFFLSRFEEHDAPVSRSFFTDILASISDIKFSKDGRHILSRDYMTVKVRHLTLIQIIIVCSIADSIAI